MGLIASCFWILIEGGGGSGTSSAYQIMSRWSGNDKHFDGYSFHGGREKDSRHAHTSIHPKFRSARDDIRRSQDGFGWVSKYDSTPMNPSARGLEKKKPSNKQRVAVSTASRANVKKETPSAPLK